MSARDRRNLPVSYHLQEHAIPGRPELAALVRTEDSDAPCAWNPFVRSLDADPAAGAAAILCSVDARLPGNPPAVGCEGPAPLSALLYPPHSRTALVVRRGVLEQVGAARPVDNPIWDWLIRATALEIEVAGVEDCVTSGNGLPELPRLAPPAPSPARSWLRSHLEAATPERLGLAGRLPEATQVALRAGLFLWHDELEASHTLSQSIEGIGELQLGDVWHAILHRREPDYSNSKYWFRQIGRHPLHRELVEPARAILEQSRAPETDTWRNRLLRGDTFDPFAFVDLCQACADDEESDLAHTARTLQLAEMTLLLRMTLAG